MNPIKTTLAAITLLTGSLSHADINIRFIEGAPKDTFVIVNEGACALSTFTVEFDLSSSAGKLIFDTTAAGAGVEVFQPFEVKSGNIKLTSGEEVVDGKDQLSIEIDSLEPQQSASFTIDVDDRLTNSNLGQIRVSNSEIRGAIARVNLKDAEPAEGIFNNRSRSSITLPNCV